MPFKFIDLPIVEFPIVESSSPTFGIIVLVCSSGFGFGFSEGERAIIESKDDIYND